MTSSQSEWLTMMVICAVGKRWRMALSAGVNMIMSPMPMVAYIRILWIESNLIEAGLGNRNEAASLCKINRVVLIDSLAVTMVKFWFYV